MLCCATHTGGPDQWMWASFSDMKVLMLEVMNAYCVSQMWEEYWRAVTPPLSPPTPLPGQSNWHAGRRMSSVLASAVSKAGKKKKKRSRQRLCVLSMEVNQKNQKMFEWHTQRPSRHRKSGWFGKRGLLQTTHWLEAGVQGFVINVLSIMGPNYLKYIETFVVEAVRKLSAMERGAVNLQWVDSDQAVSLTRWHISLSQYVPLVPVWETLELYFILACSSCCKMYNPSLEIM